MEGNVSRLKLLFLSHEKKVQCYYRFFSSMNMSFLLKSIVRVKRHNSGVRVMGSTFNEFEVDYYGKLLEVIDLRYHSE
jgi:hypothetical protein